MIKKEKLDKSRQQKSKSKSKSIKQQMKDNAEKEKKDILFLKDSKLIYQYWKLSWKEREEFINNIKKERLEKQEEEETKLAKKPKNIVRIKNGKRQVCVMVLNMRGQPLMPCSPRKARVLLKEEKAKVVNRCPFAIQLKYPTGETKQPIILGLDTGYKFVGFSASTDKREVLSGEVELRTDIPDKLNERSMYRRGRRNRNTRYRSPRFDNRMSWKKKEGWLAPSLQHKLDTYIRLVQKFENILPITGITIEVSPFDTQKMMNPEIKGIEYQQGTLQGYEVREYLLEKWHHQCAYCGVKNVTFEIEHIIPPSRYGLGGSNRISNMTIACHDCNQKKGNMTAAEFGHPEVQILAQKSLKDAAFMNIIRARLLGILREEFPNYEINSIYGYVTKYWRIKSNIEKSHANDAFVISNFSEERMKKINQIIRSKPYHAKQIRRNNRQLQMNIKGHKPHIRKKRYPFSYGDLVIKKDSEMNTNVGWGDKLNKKEMVIYKSKGVFNKGEWIRTENPILGKKDLNFKVDDVKILKYGAGLLFQLPNYKYNSNGKTKECVDKKTNMINKQAMEAENDI